MVTSSEERFCQTCGFKPKSENELKAHMRDIHKDPSKSTSPPPKKKKENPVQGILDSIVNNAIEEMEVFETEMMFEEQRFYSTFAEIEKIENDAEQLKTDEDKSEKDIEKEKIDWVKNSEEKVKRQNEKIEIDAIMDEKRRNERQIEMINKEKEEKLKNNKYAIYAYTHGPVTGSGPSVKPLKYDVAPYWLS